MYYRSKLNTIIFFLFCAAILPVGCRKSCTDIEAVNYNPGATVGDPRSCIYDYTYLAIKNYLGQWTYSDTFTYYPPNGGAPNTSITPYFVTIEEESGTTLSLNGFQNDQYYFADVLGDTMQGRGTTFILSANHQTITFNDGTTNSAIGYMRKQ